MFVIDKVDGDHVALGQFDISGSKYTPVTVCVSRHLWCVCVCVCMRTLHGESGHKLVHECDVDDVFVCVFVCVKKPERESVCEERRERGSVCVCVCEERRTREGECVCVCFCV